MSKDPNLCVHPIPKKPSSFILYQLDTQPPCLRDLTSDCFLRSINQLDDPYRLKISTLFQKYVEKLHCEENLEFLIEIYKYEYYFDNIFPGTSDRRRLNSNSMTSLPFSSFVSLSSSLPQLPKVSNSNSYSNIYPGGDPQYPVSYSPIYAPFDSIPPPNEGRPFSSTTSPEPSRPITGSASVPKSVPLSNLPITRTLPDPSFPSYSRASKTPSLYSVKSEDLDPQAVLVATIDNLDPQPQGFSTKSVWDDLRLKNINDDDDDSLIGDGASLRSTNSNQNLMHQKKYANSIDDHTENMENNHDTKYSNLNPIDLDLLTYQWNHILNNYIVHYAPNQINLSEKLIKHIIDEHKLGKEIHCPSMLLKARNEVLNLINENAYLGFLNKCKQDLALTSPNPILSPVTSSITSPITSPTTSPPMESRLYGKQAIPKSIATSSSPLLTPVTSNSALSKTKLKKNRFLKLSSSASTLEIQNSPKTPPVPTATHSASTQTQTLITENLTSSNSSSSSSITNLFGHLKLGNHFSSSNHTPTPSNLHSLATSPINTSSSPDIKSPSSASSLKFWSKKKN
jgi:hypothetical protein